MSNWFARVPVQWWNTLQQQWWTELPAFQKVFWLIAIPFTVVFLIQLITTILGFGGEGVDGFDVDESGDSSGFSLLTIRNLVIFCTVFGWTGITLANAGESEPTTIVISIAVGLIVMFFVAMLFYFTTRLTESGNIDLKYATGQTGEVYLPIPGKRTGIGKIHITFQGSLKEIEAMTADEETIASGSLVCVVEVLTNGIVLVKQKQSRGK